MRGASPAERSDEGLPDSVAAAMEWIFLVLAVAVLVFGVGVLVVNRRRSGAIEAPPARPPIAAPPRPDARSRPRRGAGRAAVEAPIAPVPVKPASLRERLSKARSAFTGAFAGVLGRSTITDETWDDLEEALLRADVGLGVTESLLDDLKARVKSKEITEPDQLLDALQAEMVGTTRRAPTARSTSTTRSSPAAPTCGCSWASTASARRPRSARSPNSRSTADARCCWPPATRSAPPPPSSSARGPSVAAPSSSAAPRAAIPSSVIFDGVERAAARDIDLVLADTAGRLHTKTNLMEELEKVRRVAEKGAGTVTETLLVIDATTGQNGLAQAREFREATDVTGVVLTKLDGSAKGGIVFAIETELGIPVKLVGVGEQIGDLIAFDPDEFVPALFDTA